MEAFSHLNCSRGPRERIFFQFEKNRLQLSLKKWSNFSDKTLFPFTLSPTPSLSLVRTQTPTLVHMLTRFNTPTQTQTLTQARPNLTHSLFFLSFFQKIIQDLLHLQSHPSDPKLTSSTFRNSFFPNNSICSYRDLYDKRPVEIYITLMNRSHSG